MTVDLTNLKDTDTVDVVMQRTNRVVAMTGRQYRLFLQNMALISEVWSLLNNNDPDSYFPKRERGTNTPSTRKAVREAYMADRGGI